MVHRGGSNYGTTETTPLILPPNSLQVQSELASPALPIKTTTTIGSSTAICDIKKTSTIKTLQRRPAGFVHRRQSLPNLQFHDNNTRLQQQSRTTKVNCSVDKKCVDDQDNNVDGDDDDEDDDDDDDDISRITQRTSMPSSSMKCVQNLNETNKNDVPFVKVKSTKVGGVVSGSGSSDNIDAGSTMTQKCKIKTDDNKVHTLQCSLPLERLSGVLSTLSARTTINGPTVDQQQQQQQQHVINKSLCLYCDRSFCSQKLRAKHSERIHLSVSGRRSSSRKLNGTGNGNAANGNDGNGGGFAGCSYCNNGKAFSSFGTDLKALFTHLVDQHNDKYFGCKLCILRFPVIDALQTHQATLHGTVVILSACSKKVQIDNSTQADENEIIETKLDESSIISDERHGEEINETDKEESSNNIRKMATRQSAGKLSAPSPLTTSVAIQKKHQLLRNEEPMLSRLGVAQHRSPRTRKGAKNRRGAPTEPRSSSETSNGRSSRNRISRSMALALAAITNNETAEYNSSAPSKPVSSKEPVNSTFDDDFYEKVNINVRTNLGYYLDGKLENGPLISASSSILNHIESVIPTVRSTVVRSPIIADSEIHEATSLSAITPFPTLLTADQYGTECISPNKIKRTITKNSWKWKWDFVKKYKYVNEGGKIVKKIKQQTTGLRDLSKLDMWTQLTMRTKHELLQRNDSVDGNQQIVSTLRDEKRKLIEQLNTILDTRLLPQIVLEQNDQRLIKLEPIDDLIDANGDDNNVEIVQNSLNHVMPDPLKSDTSNADVVPSLEEDNFPAILNLKRRYLTNHPKNSEVILSGEWARPRCYVCVICGAKFDAMKAMEEHKNFQHPHVYSSHYEIVGRELIEGQLYKHLYIPTKALQHSSNVVNPSQYPITPIIGGNSMEDSMDSITSCTVSTKCDSFDTDSNSRISKSSSTTQSSSNRKSIEVTNCTKCNRECTGRMDLYRHMLDCVGDYAWLLAKKRLKYRYYGNRRKRRHARTKFGCLRPPQKTPKAPLDETRVINANDQQRKQSQQPRTRPSDAESIQRMLANLPAKRATRSILPNMPVKKTKLRKLVAPLTAVSTVCKKFIAKRKTRASTNAATITTSTAANSPKIIKKLPSKDGQKIKNSSLSSISGHINQDKQRETSLENVSAKKRDLNTNHTQEKKKLTTVNRISTRSTMLNKKISKINNLKQASKGIIKKLNSLQKNKNGRLLRKHSSINRTRENVEGKETTRNGTDDHKLSSPKKKSPFPKIKKTNKMSQKINSRETRTKQIIKTSDTKELLKETLTEQKNKCLKNKQLKSTNIRDNKKVTENRESFLENGLEMKQPEGRVQLSIEQESISAIENVEISVSNVVDVPNKDEEIIINNKEENELYPKKLIEENTERISETIESNDKSEALLSLSTNSCSVSSNLNSENDGVELKKESETEIVNLVCKTPTSASSTGESSQQDPTSAKSTPGKRRARKLTDCIARLTDKLQEKLGVPFLESSSDNILNKSTSNSVAIIPDDAITPTKVEEKVSKDAEKLTIEIIDIVPSKVVEESPKLTLSVNEGFVEEDEKIPTEKVDIIPKAVEESPKLSSSTNERIIKEEKKVNIIPLMIIEESSKHTSQFNDRVIDSHNDKMQNLQTYTANQYVPIYNPSINFSSLEADMEEGPLNLSMAKKPENNIPTNASIRNSNRQQAPPQINSIIPKCTRNNIAENVASGSLIQKLGEQLTERSVNIVKLSEPLPRKSKDTNFGAKTLSFTLNPVIPEIDLDKNKIELPEKPIESDKETVLKKSLEKIISSSQSETKNSLESKETEITEINNRFTISAVTENKILITENVEMKDSSEKLPVKSIEVLKSKSQQNFPPKITKARSKKVNSIESIENVTKSDQLKDASPILANNNNKEEQSSEKFSKRSNELSKINKEIEIESDDDVPLAVMLDKTGSYKSQKDIQSSSLATIDKSTQLKEQVNENKSKDSMVENIIDSAQMDNRVIDVSNEKLSQHDTLISLKTSKPRKRRKNELAAIIADQLLESFKEVDKSRIDELKMLHDLSCEKNKNTDDLLVSTIGIISTPKRKVTCKTSSAVVMPTPSPSPIQLLITENQKSSENKSLNNSANIVHQEQDKMTSQLELIEHVNEKSPAPNNDVSQTPDMKQPTTVKNKDNNCPIERTPVEQIMDKNMTKIVPRKPQKSNQKNIPEMKNENANELIIINKSNDQTNLPKVSNNLFATNKSNSKASRVTRQSMDLKQAEISQNKTDNAGTDDSSIEKSIDIAETVNILKEDLTQHNFNNGILTRRTRSKIEEIFATPVEKQKNLNKSSDDLQLKIDEIDSIDNSFDKSMEKSTQITEKLAETNDENKTTIQSKDKNTKSKESIKNRNKKSNIKMNVENRQMLKSPDMFLSAATINLNSSPTKDNNSVLKISSLDASSWNGTEKLKERADWVVRATQLNQQQPKVNEDLNTNQISGKSKFTLKPSRLQAIKMPALSVSFKEPLIDSPKESPLFPNLEGFSSTSDTNNLNEQFDLLKNHQVDNNKDVVIEKSIIDEVKIADKNFQNKKEKSKNQSEEIVIDKLKKSLGPTTVMPDDRINKNDQYESDEDDTCLAEIAKSLNSKIQSSDEFSNAVDVLPVEEIPEPTIQSNETSKKDNENTNTELVDMDLEDTMSVFTNNSVDSSLTTQTNLTTKKNLNRKRKNRKYVFSSTRRNKVNKTLDDTEAEKYFCDICNKYFQKQDRLAKHKMTLTHIAKLSEQEFINSQAKTQLQTDEKSPEIIKDRVSKKKLEEVDSVLIKAVEPDIVEDVIPPKPIELQESPTTLKSSSPPMEESKITANITEEHSIGKMSLPIPAVSPLCNINQTGIEPISSPEQLNASSDRYSTMPIRSGDIGEPARLTLSQEEKLFYECCNMLKGSDRTATLPENANENQSKYYHWTNKPVTPKSNEQANCYESHNAVYSVKSPMSHSHLSPRHAFPKIDSNQFSDISSDSNPIAYSRHLQYSKKVGNSQKMYILDDTSISPGNNRIKGFLESAEKYFKETPPSSSSLQQYMSGSKKEDSELYDENKIEYGQQANLKKSQSYSDSFSDDDADDDDMGDSFPSSQDVSESENYVQTIMERSCNKTMDGIANSSMSFTDIDGIATSDKNKADDGISSIVSPGSFLTERNLKDNKTHSIRSFDSPIHSTASSQCSTTSKIRTKGAMKGYDNFKVSIPTNGLDLQQALVRNPHVGSKLAALADIALGGDVAPLIADISPPPKIISVDTDPEISLNNKLELKCVHNEVNNKNVFLKVPFIKTKKIGKIKTTKAAVVGNKLGFKSRKNNQKSQKINKTEKHKETNVVQPITFEKLTKKTLDIYEFEESEDSVDAPILPLIKTKHLKSNAENIVPLKSSDPEKIETEKSQLPKKSEINSTHTVAPVEDDSSRLSSTSFSDRDDFNYNSNLSEESDSENQRSNVQSPSTNKKPTKKIPDNIQKKCLIMGRIFKNAQKNRPPEVTVPSPETTVKKPLPKVELDKLFDSLKGVEAQKSNHDLFIGEKESNKQKTESVSNTEKKLNNSINKKSNQESKKSNTSTQNVDLKQQQQRTKKSREIAMLEAEWGMSLEQIEEIIGVGQRKSQRKCATGKQKILAETWSSDEYEEFQSTKDIIALIQEKEFKASQQLQKSKNKTTVQNKKKTSDSKVIIEKGKESKEVNDRLADGKDAIKENIELHDDDLPLQKRTGEADDIKKDIRVALGLENIKEKSLSMVKENKKKLKLNRTHSNVSDIEDGELNKRVENDRSKIKKRRKTIAFKETEKSPSSSSSRRQLSVSSSNSTKKSRGTTSDGEESRAQPFIYNKNIGKGNPSTSLFNDDVKQAGRRKRVSSEMLYYWSSSSSDDEFGRIKSSQEDDDDEDLSQEGGEHLQQHGWIVGDSHKKLVTLLAHAKGKKTDECSVKESHNNKKNRS